jgi:hypothetical protein
MDPSKVFDLERSLEEAAAGYRPWTSGERSRSSFAHS